MGRTLGIGSHDQLFYSCEDSSCWRSCCFWEKRFVTLTRTFCLRDVELDLTLKRVIMNKWQLKKGNFKVKNASISPFFRLIRSRISVNDSFCVIAKI